MEVYWGHYLVLHTGDSLLSMSEREGKGLFWRTYTMLANILHQQQTVLSEPFWNGEVCFVITLQATVAWCIGSIWWVVPRVKTDAELVTNPKAGPMARCN